MKKPAFSWLDCCSGSFLYPQIAGGQDEQYLPRARRLLRRFRCRRAPRCAWQYLVPHRITSTESISRRHQRLNPPMQPIPSLRRAGRWTFWSFTL